MTTSHDPGDRMHDQQQPQPGKPKGRKGHGWMMIVCCIPMLAIAIALVATGVANGGFLVAAVVCTVMMALMMRGMGHDDGRM